MTLTNIYVYVTIVNLPAKVLIVAAAMTTMMTSTPGRELPRKRSRRSVMPCLLRPHNASIQNWGSKGSMNYKLFPFPISISPPFPLLPFLPPFLLPLFFLLFLFLLLLFIPSLASKRPSFV